MQGDFTRKLEMARQRLGELNTSGEKTGIKTSAYDCTTYVNILGNATPRATQIWITPKDKSFCQQFTAPASGTLGYSCLRGGGLASPADYARVIVFSEGDADTVPDSADTYLAYGSHASTGAGNITQSSGKLGGSVTSGNKYWLCVVADATEWIIYYDTSGSVVLYQQTISGMYDNPSSTALPDSGWGTSSYRAYQVFVVIE